MPAPAATNPGRPIRAGRRAPRARGFTIVELMIAVGVLAILSSAALPELSKLVRDQRIKAATSDVYVSLIYARSEAIKRNQNVALCASTNGSACAGSTNWATGWIVFEDSDGDGLPATAADILRKQDAISGITLTGAGANVSYRRDGRLTAAPPNFVVSGTSVTSRCVRMDVSGRPNIKIGC